MKRGLPLIPIVVGAVAGALVAVMQAPKPRSAGAAAALSSAAPAPPAATPRAAEPQAPPAQATAPAALASAPIAAAPATATASAQNASGKPVFDLSEPTDAASLLEAQIACNRSVPDACERAARALESGAAGTKDPTRAKALKRIALTLYVKQCEGSRPAACARLAEMYEVGETVQKNDKSVQGLRVRVAELCKTRPTELGCAGP
jgi:hypothetical protein